MIEDKFKKLLGEYVFQITVLQHQLDEVQKELKECRQVQMAENSSKRSKD